MTTRLTAIAFALVAGMLLANPRTKEKPSSGSDKYAPIKHEFPTEVRMWVVNEQWMKGQIVSEDKSKEIYEFEEETPTGKKRKRLIRQKDFSSKDLEFVERHTTGVISGKVTGVFDGDTLEITTPAYENHRVRLNGIDSPERGQAYKNKSKEQLSQLVHGKQVKLHVLKKDQYKRLVAHVFDSEDQHINLEMVKLGGAWHYEEYLKDDSAFQEAQKVAESKKIGLWKDHDPIAPWNFRKGSRPLADVYWLNLSSDKRHNGSCSQFEKTKNGRLCTVKEGEPCGICGG